MSPRKRRTKRRPCPSWCRYHFNAPDGPIHYRLAAVIERPGRHLTPMEELMAEARGRTPGYVEVDAMQIRNKRAEVQLTVAGRCATLTAEEAERVGSALLALSFSISFSHNQGADSPDGT